MRFVIGIDGGGTGCRAALATADGRILGRGRSGAANIRTDLSGAGASIAEAARMAIAEAGHDPGLVSQIPALLGLAGSNVGTYRRQIESLLPFGRHIVVSDALVALEGALGSGDGAIAILGTGSAYMARHGGEVRTIGGWGFLVGDQASGARLGRDLMEEALLAHDGIREKSPMTEAFLDSFQNDPRAVVEFTTTAKPGDFARFAPMLFEHDERGDTAAGAILARAVADIDRSLAVLRLGADDPLCLLGGLAPLYTPRLARRWQANLRPAGGDGLDGAVALAVRSFGRATDG